LHDALTRIGYGFKGHRRQTGVVKLHLNLKRSSPLNGLLLLPISLILVLAGCSRNVTKITPKLDGAPEPSEIVHNLVPDEEAKFEMMDSEKSSQDTWLSQRKDMLEHQIHRRGIQDRRVLDAMAQVPRHVFVPRHLQHLAYDDGPLPIGFGQTISQPYIVALMTELVRPLPTDRALDIGTGCGYQAAVLSGLVSQVYSIEIVESLAIQAGSRLKEHGYTNVEVHYGDGYQGWLKQAPFQVIVVAAAPDHVPQPLLDQLALGGRMVIPVGKLSQELMLIEKSQDGALKRTTIAPVAFVPMTGAAEKR